MDYFGLVKMSLLILLAVVPVAAAQEARQENESEGMKRILSPTLNSATNLQDKSFYGGADKGFSTKVGNVKSFQWTDFLRLKTYSGAKNFGAKEYWAGNFETKAAGTQGKYVIPNVATKSELKTSAVREDRDQNKVQETRDYEKNRPYLVPGKAQKALDSQQEAQKPLTVDDVRKLLNTTR